MIINALLLTLFTTFQPARPTIGDPITINFASPVTLDASSDYEVVSRSGNRVVIRAFVPHSIAVNGRSAEGPVTVMIPVHSVLAPNDKMTPAPLRPPLAEPWPRMPFVAIGIAFLAAVGIWTAVALLAKRRVSRPRTIVPPRDALRVAVARARGWATLANALRAYLASIRPDLGAELTTSELLARADAPPALAHILRQGDLEKFSPWGATASDFDAAAHAALDIASWAEPPVVVEEEQAA
jgi:hypothetical protein